VSIALAPADEMLGKRPNAIAISPLTPRRESKHIAVIAVRTGTRAARATLSCRFGSETAIPSPLYQFEKRDCFIRALRAKERLRVVTKRYRG
jgi:hypothetical protein